MIPRTTRGLHLEDISWRPYDFTAESVTNDMADMAWHLRQIREHLIAYTRDIGDMYGVCADPDYIRAVFDDVMDEALLSPLQQKVDVLKEEEVLNTMVIRRHSKTEHMQRMIAHLTGGE
jgi:hypothetical protein